MIENYKIGSFILGGLAGIAINAGIMSNPACESPEDMVRQARPIVLDYKAQPYFKAAKEALEKKFGVGLKTRLRICEMARGFDTNQNGVLDYGEAFSMFLYSQLPGKDIPLKNPQME